MAPALRFGILIEQRDAWPAIVERVRRYEAFGVDTVWLADCFANPYDPQEPWFEAWSLLAGLATQTSRIRLGTLITHVVYRNPALLARQAMTVDHLSGGRLELGMGAGASEQDWAMTLGTAPWPQNERVERLEEAVTIVDRLLRNEVTSFAGHYYQMEMATLAPGALQRPRPPLTIAAHGPVSLRIAARYADTWNTAGLYWTLDPKRATAVDALRRTRELSLRLDEQASAAGRHPGSIKRSVLVGWEWPVATATPWASLEAFQEFIGQYHELGFTEFIAPEPTPAQHVVLEGVASDVLPALRAAGTGHGG